MFLIGSTLLTDLTAENLALSTTVLCRLLKLLNISSKLEPKSAGPRSSSDSTWGGIAVLA